ncbi:MAG TPA: very short patch repair endonuclease [Rhizomicrobium sp.]|nr:very short patch repair endonuclease [Rhizomicrobium sp.]
MDRLTPQRRSWLMSRVKGRNTTPERAVRSIVHRLGYRFRLNRRDLPGKPDIVFGPRKKVVFVHGCFWHGHGCAKGRLPKSNEGFWRDKIVANRKRDARQLKDLHALGWKTLVIWQCELDNPLAVKDRIADFLA